MSARFLICLLLLCPAPCLAGEVENALGRAGLAEKAIPAGDAWVAANHHQSSYVVANEGGQLAIQEVHNFHRPQALEASFDGKRLVGTNQGEWGGNLSTAAADGSRQILVRDNIVQLIQEQDELFVFSGLAHMGYAQGAIHKLTPGKEDIHTEKVTLLPGAPEAVITERNDRGYFAFLIVTNDGLLSFSPKYGGMKVLAIDQFWHGLYPTSAQLVDSQLVIGMRSGVAVLSFGLPATLGAMHRVTKVQYFSK